MYTNNYSNSVSTNSLYKVYSWMMVGLGITRQLQTAPQV